VNHKPIIDEDSEAIWRRIHLIPFNVHFVEPEKAHEGDLVQDRDLPRVLKRELNGILNWAVQGCLIWQRDELQPPEDVQLATETYRKESDVVGRFLEQEIVEEEGKEEGATDLYEAYKSWCESEGEKPLNQTNFGRRLTERGFVKKAKPHITYQGLRLLNFSHLNREERIERLKERYKENSRGR
jgi:putative DNA primase/helicase